MSTIPAPSLSRRGTRSGDDEPEGRIGRLVPFALLSMALALAAACVIVAISSLNSSATAEPPAGGHSSHATAGAAAAAIPADDKSVKFEEYQEVDPTLPPIPEGAVKKFKVDVFEHVTKVAADKPALNVWSYGINGKYYRGTGASTPMVVTEGDKVEIELINGSSDKMTVQFPHSIDYHSSEIAPNKAFATIEPGKTKKFEFVAKHAGVFMYHCATDPVLLHTGAGIVGMMIVKPRDLAPVDKELWVTQQEFYFGEKAGANPSVEKMEAKQPDVITFNGYANQYKDHPISVKKGEKVRMYVLNAGPSIWSAFHVIGTVFDKTVIEGTVGKSVQTVNLAPSQGGYVEFTLDDEGNFPFVTHAFGDMVKGAVGVLQTENSTAKGMGH